MEDIDSDCSDDEFDGYVDDEVIKALPGVMNNSGTAIEMMNIIMNRCNIAAVQDVVMKKIWLCVQCKVTLVCAMEKVLVVASLSSLHTVVWHNGETCLWHKRVTCL